MWLESERCMGSFGVAPFHPSLVHLSVGDEMTSLDYGAGVAGFGPDDFSDTKQATVVIVPTTLPVANALVTRWHRHHAPIPGGFGWFCLGAIVNGEMRGVAIGGRPTNRNNDDRQTIEVLRLASDGTDNVCSALLGACGRVGRAMGASRVITYTLERESGTSLKAVGWVREEDGIQSWWATGQSRTRGVQRDHMADLKVRWALNIRPPVEYEPPSIDEETNQGVLNFADQVGEPG